MPDARSLMNITYRYIPLSYRRKHRIYETAGINLFHKNAHLQIEIPAGILT